MRSHLLILFLLVALASSSRILQILRVLSPECNNHGYIYKNKCFCQTQWKGDKCQTSSAAGWFDTDSKCDDLVVRLDYLTNIASDAYFYDDDEFPRMTGNSIGDGDASYGDKGSSWIKMHDLNSDFSVISNSVTPSDIHQGALGNCYLLAAFASLANIRNGELIKSFFVELPDYKNKVNLPKNNVYVTRWLINGKPRYVSVDDWVPGKDNEPSFSKTTGDHDVWGLILEKAWAKIHGNYMITQAGWHTNVWHSLTEAPIFNIYHDNTTTSDFIFNKVKSLLSSEFAVGAATVNIKSTHEVGGHAYSILGAYEIKLENGDSQRLFKMYNPWHAEVWSDNPWADTDAKWTDYVKNQIPSYVNEDDGQFFVTPQAYLENFGVTNWAEVKKDYESSYLDIAIKSDDSVNYNATFTLTGGANKDIYFFIDQFDSRLLASCGSPLSIGSLVVKDSNNKKFTGDYYDNTVKIEAAKDGVYTVTFSAQRKQAFLKYFTITTYAPAGKVDFSARANNDINFNGKTCPSDCSKHGKCNSFNGTCSCYFGFAGSDCSQAVTQTCPNNCNNQGVCDKIYGMCNSCNPGFTGKDCSPCVDDETKGCDYYISIGYCEPTSKWLYYTKESCQKSCGKLGFKEGFGTCYIEKGTPTPTPTPPVPVPVNKCKNINCSNNGQCDSQTGYCECDAGFSGNNCETIVPPPVPTCKDMTTAKDCEMYKSYDYCKVYPDNMSYWCPYTCNLCPK